MAAPAKAIDAATPIAVSSRRTRPALPRINLAKTRSRAIVKLQFVSTIALYTPGTEQAVSMETKNGIITITTLKACLRV